jgi:hypothetical protein
VPYVEQDIRRAMPASLTLRDEEARALATAMPPPKAQADPAFRPVIVGRDYGGPYPRHGDAIDALARRFDVTLDRARRYPYRRHWPVTGDGARVGVARGLRATPCPRRHRPGAAVAARGAG